MNTQIENIRTSEIATGLVNGINKAFSVTQRINTLESILVNSLPYAQATFSGSVVTLDDAPATGTVEITYTYISNVDYNDVSAWITGETMS
jgi:hypothetical protein